MNRLPMAFLVETWGGKVDTPLRLVCRLECHKMERDKSVEKMSAGVLSQQTNSRHSDSYCEVSIFHQKTRDLAKLFCETTLHVVCSQRVVFIFHVVHVMPKLLLTPHGSCAWIIAKLYGITHHYLCLGTYMRLCNNH